MGFNCGIIGLPNVGKSTIFNALSSGGAQAANYPFCTIEPNSGIVPVPDDRLDRIAELVNPAKVTPTTIEFVDIAGLVKGASKGEGLGNQFLGHIREVDAVLHVVRMFEDDDIAHVEGGIDPARDIGVINLELILADLQTIEKRLEAVRKKTKSGKDVDAKKLQDRLEALQSHLEADRLARTIGDEATVNAALEIGLLTAKPCLYVANISEDQIAEHEAVTTRLCEAAGEPDARAIALCGQFEADLSELDGDERAEFLAEAGLAESGLRRLIREGYALLGLLTYFTAGPKEARAWTVTAGSKAPQAAGKIHGDFERGFIRAEVIAYDDFIALGGESKAREAGKLRTEGKEYVVKDGDVMHYLFNV